nr:hypothetical protein [Thiorhodovibrio frisius]
MALLSQDQLDCIGILGLVRRNGMIQRADRDGRIRQHALCQALDIR